MGWNLQRLHLMCGLGDLTPLLHLSLSSHHHFSFPPFLSSIFSFVLWSSSIVFVFLSFSLLHQFTSMSSYVVLNVTLPPVFFSTSNFVYCLIFFLHRPVPSLIPFLMIVHYLAVYTPLYIFYVVLIFSCFVLFFSSSEVFLLLVSFCYLCYFILVVIINSCCSVWCVQHLLPCV